MKIIALLLMSLVISSRASADASNGFMHLWMKDGKFERLHFFHYQLDVGAVLMKSKLMNVKVRNGESFYEYTGESKDKNFTITDAVGFGKSTFKLELPNITEMNRGDYYYKNFKWQLSGPSIDSFYNVLAELDAVDTENVIEKTVNREGDATYSIGHSVGNDRGSIACFIDRGGNGQPTKAPVKACLFSEP